MSEFVRLETKKDIRTAQKRLEEICTSELKNRSRHHIGYPAGMLRDCDVRSDGKYWVWQKKMRPEGKAPRYLNFFGHTQSGGGNLSIALEVNVYTEGRKRSLAGFFAKNPGTGHLYLMHNGGIGGGTKGQNKYNFLVWLDREMTEVVDSEGRIEHANIVMSLSGIRNLETAFSYVDEVALFKSLLRERKLDPDTLTRAGNRLRDYCSEGAGRRRGHRGRTIDYVSRHGFIVDALKVWREEKGIGTSRLVNDRFLDLAVEANTRILELYEVKTSLDRQSIYCALGQLFVYDGNSDPERFIVLPNDYEIASDLEAAFKRLDVHLVTFEATGKTFRFESRYRWK